MPTTQPAMKPAGSRNWRVLRRAHRFSYRPSLPLRDIACALLVAFFAMQGAIPGIAPSQALESTNAAPTAWMKVGGIASQLLVDGLIALFLLTRCRLLSRCGRAMQYAAPLAIFAVVSTLWSVDPLLTARRSLPFALAGLFGLWFAATFSQQRQRRILWMAMIALALGTIVLAVFLPKMGLDHSPGHASDWQGVFTQKNACGRMMVLATAAVLSERRIGAAKLASLALFLFVLAMSGSRGAWAIEAIVFALAFLLRLMRRMEGRSRVLFSCAVIAAGGVAAIVALTWLREITALMGRDATLSGRTAIWKQVWRFIALRPLQGYGYAAFWQGIHGESFKVVVAVRFIVFHAHNGFLEIWLELGAIGLLLFLLSYLRAWRRLWPMLRRGEIDRIAWPLFVLVLIALYDLDENTLLIYNGLFWVLYVAAISSIELLCRHSEAERHGEASRPTLALHPSSTLPHGLPHAPGPALSY